MVVVMQEGSTEEQIQHVIDKLVAMGLTCIAPPGLRTPAGRGGRAD